jgi:predicted nucleic acid-binding Zn ribbon protein
MAQTSGHPCPACGTIVPTGQRFCTNCGVDTTTAQPANQSSQYGGPLPQNPSMQQVPPYAQAPNAQQQYNPLLDQQQQQTNPLAEVLGALGLLFFMRRYRPGYEARRQRHGACGCLFMLMVLVAVIIIIGILVSASRSGSHSRNSIQQPANSSLFAYEQKSSAVAASISAQRSTWVISDHSTMACAPLPPGPKITVGMPAAERSAASVQAAIPPSEIS